MRLTTISRCPDFTGQFTCLEFLGLLQMSMQVSSVSVVLLMASKSSLNQHHKLCTIIILTWLNAAAFITLDHNINVATIQI